MISFHPKTTILTDIFVMFKILSSEYQLYACGKIFHMPRSRSKMHSFRRETMTSIASKILFYCDKRLCFASSDLGYTWTVEGA